MKNNKNIPQLRFPEFNKEWATIKYGEKFTFLSTNSLSREKLNYTNGNVKNIHYGDIHTKYSSLFNIENENVPYVNEEVDLSRIKEENYCIQGDIIIADASEDYKDIGKTIEIIYVENESLISGLHTFHARPIGKRMALGFVSYLLQSWKSRRQVMVIAQGSKVLGLSSKRLANIYLDIPLFQEQEKIVKLLSNIDEKIEQLSIKKIKIEKYKKGLIDRIFNKKVKFKNKEGENFSEWKVKSLGEIGRTYNGLTGKTKINFGEGYPYIQYMQIYSNIFIDPTMYGLVSIEKDEKQNQVRFGDILFTTSSETPHEVGTSSVFLNHQKEVYLNSFCFGFRPNSILEIIPKFAQYLFSNELIRRKIIKLAQGSTRFNISKIAMMKLTIELPEKEEQELIGDFLDEVESRINQINESLKSIKAFKVGLIQQLFI